MKSIFNKFCAPAVIYLTFSLAHTMAAISNEDKRGALVQLFLGILVTLLLQILCLRGLNFLSWIIILLPFIFYTYIVLILYEIFGIRVISSEKNEKVVETDKTT